MTDTIHTLSDEDKAVLDLLLDTSTSHHRAIDGADYSDLLQHDGTVDLGLVWAPRIRTWDDATAPYPATEAWQEPAACTCKYPHGYRPECQHCMIEYFAKGRRTWDEHFVSTNRHGEEYDDPRWIYDADGEFGAHYQSAEIGGFRAHVTHYPTHGPRHMGSWLIVITEFLFERPVTFTRGGNEITYTQRARQVIGFEEVHDYAEGFYRAQELTEQWRATQDYEQNGWSVVDQGPVLPDMGAAVVSLEFLDHLASTRNGEVIA